MAPNYSVRVSDDRRSLHLLYWGGRLVARCRTEDALVTALDAHLAGHEPAPPTSVRLDGIAIRRGDAAVVLTHVDQSFVAKVLGRLRDIDADVEIRPWVDVDPSTLVLAARPSAGLRPGHRAPATVLGLVVPRAISELGIGDRLMTLQRTGTIAFTSAGTALRLLETVNTVSVEDYDVSRVARSIRTILEGSADRSWA